MVVKLTIGQAFAVLNCRHRTEKRVGWKINLKMLTASDKSFCSFSILASGIVSHS